jgi:Spy/CpxP family protein refolding chaperone
VTETVRWRQIVIVALIAFAAAAIGVVAGRTLAPQAKPAETELHALLHRELDLTKAQHRELDEIEGRFASRRAELEAEMRADNARLAAAISAEKGYGPRVTAAIDHSHALMGELQKTTLEHVFEMRSVLTPDQAATFDRTVVAALTQTGSE